MAIYSGRYGQKAIMDMRKAICLFLVVLVATIPCSGCSQSSVDITTSSGGSSDTFGTYVNEVLIPELGYVPEDDYIGEYSNNYCPDMPNGVMTSSIRDFDNDGSDELLALVLETDNGSYGLPNNHVSLQIYEEEDGEAVLKDKYLVLEGIFSGLYEISGIFLTEFDGQVYICGSYSDAYSMWSDGGSWDTFVITYEGETFIPEYEYEQEGYSGIFDDTDTYSATVTEMEEFLDHIGLEDELKYFQLSGCSFFRMADEQEEILMMVVGSPDGKLDHYESMYENHVYTLSCSGEAEYKSYENDSGYLCPFSAFYLIDNEDMEILESGEYGSLPSGMSLAQMMINEIYALHGYSFPDGRIQNYFRQKSWYTAKNSDIVEVYTDLSDIEKENIDFLAGYISEANGTGEEDRGASFSFSDLSGCTFCFSSGVGAWQTYMAIYEDGTFAGVFSDWDAGPSGVTDDGKEWYSQYQYSCFYGEFINLKQVDETTYSAEIEYLEQDGLIGTEEVWGERLYINSYPYGLDDAETIMFYLPESKVIDLPEEFRDLVLWGETTISDPNLRLGFYGLYNVNGMKGFCGSYDSTGILSLAYYSERLSTEKDYILPESSTRVYTADELAGLTVNQLRLARNEIYARHHYIFDDDDLRDYFYSCAWYFGMIPSDEFDNSLLSDIEKTNIATINDAEAKVK